MRKLDRTAIAAPASLSTPSAPVGAEIATAAAYYNAKNPWTDGDTAYPFKMYKEQDVKAALRTLTEGKCAYCESKINAVGAREVEHYRPKGGIEGVADHPGYWWLAHTWDNLLQHASTATKARDSTSSLQT